jgi:hypothetical protein
MRKFKLFMTIFVTFLVLGTINVKALQGGENPDVTFSITNSLGFFDIRSTEVINGQTEFQLDWIAGEKLNQTELNMFLNQTPGIGSSKGTLYLTLQVALNLNGAYKNMTHINNTGAYDKAPSEVVYVSGADDRVAKASTFNFWPYGLKYEIKDATTGNFRSPTSAEKNAISAGSIKYQLAQLLDVEESEVADLYLEEYRFSTLNNRFYIMRYDFYDANNVLLNENPEFFKITYNRITPVIATEDKISLLNGAQYQLEQTVTYGEEKTPLTSNIILYESSDSNIVSVDENGKLTALTSGTTTVKVYLKGWKDLIYSDISVTVNAGSHEVIENQQIFEAEKENLDVIPANELSVYKTSEEKYKLTVNSEEKFVYSWEFDEIENAIDFNPTISIVAAKNNNNIKTLVDDSKALVLSFEHEGNLPGTAKVSINVDGIYNDGSKINLYYYNPTTKKAELISENLLVTNGMVEIELNHCSDYILATSLVKIKNPQTGDGIITSILIGSISIIGILGCTLFLNKKKKYN